MCQVWIANFGIVLRLLFLSGLKCRALLLARMLLILFPFHDDVIF